MWTDKTSEEYINKIKIPLKISTHLRGALNISLRFSVFEPRKQKRETLRAVKKRRLQFKQKQSYGDESYVACLVLLHGSTQATSVSVSMRSFRHRSSLDGLCVLGPAGSGGAEGCGVVTEEKEENTTPTEGGGGEADQGPCRSLESCFLGPCV